MDYYLKYLKYKNKYLQLKNQHGGCLSSKLTLSLYQTTIDVLFLGVIPSELKTEPHRLKNLISGLQKLGFDTENKQIRITLCDRIEDDPLVELSSISDGRYNFKISVVIADFNEKDFLSRFEGKTFDVIANDWSVILFIPPIIDVPDFGAAPVAPPAPKALKGAALKRFQRELQGDINLAAPVPNPYSNTDYKVTYKGMEFTVSFPEGYPFKPPTINGIKYPDKDWTPPIKIIQLFEEWNIGSFGAVIDKRRQFFDILHDKLLKQNGVLLLQSVLTELEVKGERYTEAEISECKKPHTEIHIVNVNFDSEKELTLYGPIDQITVDCLKINIGASHKKSFQLIYAGNSLDKNPDVIKRYLGHPGATLHISLSLKTPFIVEQLKLPATRLEEPFIIHHPVFDTAGDPIFYMWRKV